MCLHVGVCVAEWLSCLYIIYILRNYQGNLFFMYQSFAVKHLELLTRMAKNLPQKDIMKNFIKEAEAGRGIEFLKSQGSLVRTSILRYGLYAAGVTTALNQIFGINIWKSFATGAIPFDITKRLPELIGDLWEGDWSGL